MIFAVLLACLIALAYGPQLWVRAVMRWHGEEIPGMPGNGGELARHLVERFEMRGVGVERTDARGDHYDPRDRTVRLSPETFERKSLTAVAVAVHEVGHALQHREGNRWMALRERLYPAVRGAEKLAVLALGLLPVLTVATRSPVVVLLMLAAGLTLFFARVFFHLVTLPLEWDASFGKALPIIVEGRYVAPGEERAVRRVLRAAALTYVAAALADILSFWRWFALLRGRWI